MGQTFARLGKRDPRLNQAGNIDIHLTRQLSSYSKADPSPNRQKPIPLSVTIHTAELCDSIGSTKHKAIADMLLLAFYFLLRPGEYAFSTSPDATPFRVRHAHFFIGNRKLYWDTASNQEWEAVTTVSLEFDRQKKESGERSLAYHVPVTHDGVPSKFSNPGYSAFSLSRPTPTCHSMPTMQQM
jgi:hypothetical protein